MRVLLSWLAGKLLRFAMARLSAGDPRIVLMLLADDAELTFPGDSSFSGVFRGKPAVSEWERRFCAIGLQIVADEVVAVGPPWKTTVCARGHDWLRDASGATVYENRYVIWGHLRWGRLHRYEVYEDTAKPVGLDRWLADNRPELAGLAAR
jgi:ketosteroid isomerase-like protein